MKVVREWELFSRFVARGSALFEADKRGGII